MTKIRTVNRPVPNGPTNYVLSREAPFRHGEPETPRAFGKTIYSPRHHLDMEGRPIPAVRSEVRGPRYVPKQRPATILDLKSPLPAPAPAPRVE